MSQVIKGNTMRYIVMIFFIFCSLVLAQSTINEDTVHFIGQASAFTVGSELVANGTFDDGTVWVRGTGWQPVADGKIEKTAGVESDISQNILGLTDGRLYRIQYEVVSRSAGNVTAVFDGTELGDKSAAGVYTGYLAATGTDADIDILGDAAFAGFIDNVSVVAWTGDLDAGGGTTIAGFTGTLTDYMSATGGVLHNESGLAMSGAGPLLAIASGGTWDQTPIVGTFVKCEFSALFPDGIYEITTASASTITIDLPSTGFGAETVEVWIGGAYPDIATAVNDSTLSQGYVTVAFTGAGTYVMKPGDEIDGDTSGATATILGVTITSGSFVGGNAAGTLRITVPTVASFQAEQIDVGANNDVGDVTAAESSTYRKRYICVNVDQEVDAVTDFVAETSETFLREDDGSRKIIGFYDSISVVQPDAGYRVVSDMDRGGIYYGGAWQAFKTANGFSTVRPDGKWVEWNAKGNDINILELNTSNFGMRNIKIHNTIADSSAEGLLHIDTTNFNTQLVNCWFATSSRFVVDDLVGKGNGVLDCYFEDTIDAMNMTDFRSSYFVDCIIDLGTKADGISILDDCYVCCCLIYEGEIGINQMANSSLMNNIFFNQTVSCVVS
ncbi:hypothetical protein LCGC14_1248600, partial [marine sediment metagenome]